MPIDRLTAEDELMLRADEIWPQEVGALAILDGKSLLDPDGSFRLEAMREAVRSRLHFVPRFRQVIHLPRRGLGGPVWLDAADFDLNQHVQVRPLPAHGGEAELLVATEELRRRRLDNSRPLWEMWFLPGLPDGRVGMFVRMHHAIADGRAALAMLEGFLDTIPGALAGQAPPWTPAAPPSAGELLADSLLRQLRALVGAVSWLVRPRTLFRQLRRAWPATRELLAEAPGSETSLNRVVGPGRNLAVIRSSVESIRRIARAHEATVNDVVLAVTAGGLRALLCSRGEPVDGVTVRIYVPVSLRRRLHGQVEGNLISQMVVPLPLAISDPRLRLGQIATETTMRKARSRASLGTLFRGRLASKLLLKAVKGQRVNATSASVPGPRRPLYLAGARVLEFFPLLNLIGWVTLGVGALSYAGTFNIGVVADQDAYPDIDVFVAGMRDELRALDIRPAHDSRPGAPPAGDLRPLPGRAPTSTHVEARFLP